MRLLANSFAGGGVRVTLLAAFLASPILSCARLAFPAPIRGRNGQAGGVSIVRLPAGSFKMWCGLKDRFFVDVNGQLEAYDGSARATTVAVSSDWTMQCSDDGQHLVYVDTRMGYVTRVDIANGATLFPASYTVREFVEARISFSGDLRTVAATVPLRLSEGAAGLKVIPIAESSASESAGRVATIRWRLLILLCAGPTKLGLQRT
jgi:hypothetical protein